MGAKGASGKRNPVWRAAGLAALVAACVNPSRNEEAVVPQVTVGSDDVADVARTSLQSGPTLSGTLTAAESATLRAEAPGTIATSVERGELVEKGQLLAQIEDGALRSQLASARSAAQAAATSLDLAQREAERARKLERAGAISHRDADFARQGRAAAEAQLSAAEGREAAALDQVDRARVRSPLTGVVSERFAGSGDVVTPGALLFTVVDPTRLTLEASVPDEQAADLRVGARVDFTVSGRPSQPFTGTVDRVNPTVDPATRQVRVYASVPNSSGVLKVGLFATGRIATESRRVVAIPFDALDLRGTSPSVMRLRDGRTERVPVTLGLRDELAEKVEVLAGLEESDQVLRGPARTTAEGVEIRVRTVAEPVEQSPPMPNR